MYKWKHKTNKDWLNARKAVLTASDIKGLLSSVRKYNRSSKTYERNDKAFEDMQDGNYSDKWIGLYGEKHSATQGEDVSYGVQARGHLLERYAIEQFNADMKANYYHWDDCLIQNKQLSLGFSPDAMSIEQPTQCPVAIDIADDMPKYSILEIKCYSDAHHMQCVCCDDKAQLDERWQIACAMATDMAVEYGYVYFYNPNCDIYGEYYKYYRNDLEDEIALIWDMANAFSDMERYMPNKNYGTLLHSEDEIMAELFEIEERERGKIENLIEECEV